MNTHSVKGAPLVVGLDCGTGGARAIVSDLAGNVRGTATCNYPTAHPRPGWTEQNPADWWSAACEAVREAVARAGAAPDDILAISADGTSSTLVALDETGTPIGPAILWMDTRASAQARCMSECGDLALARCRAGVSAEWMIPRILWIKEHRPEVFERTRWFVEMADYIAYRLSGRLTLGLNQATNRWFHGGIAGGWPTEFFARIGLTGITERFPADVLALGTPIGPVLPDVAETMELGRGTLVVCGGTDAYVAMVGLDVCRPGRTAFITGSSHLVLTMTDQAGEVPGLFGPHPDCVVPGLYVLEGGQVSSGSIIKWWHDHFGMALCRDGDPYVAMMTRAAGIPIGAEGLVALDFWQGNRNPYTDYDLRGAIWGLTLKHSPDHILRALIESVAYGTENILRTLAANAITVSSLTACGGTVRSRFLLQMHADVSGLPIHVPQVSEASAFGSAIVAAVGAGAFRDLPEGAAAMVREDFMIEPDREAGSRYSSIFEDYRATHVALAPLMHAKMRESAMQA
ncbi:MAG TPA: FGGY family carbohydrate kinase [Ancylobacter sp.]